MKCKWGSCFILFIVIVIIVFGIFEKRTYTNIAEDKSYLDELYVAQLPENICLEETENLSVNLPQVPVIIRVSVLGDVEHIGGTSRQLVKVEDVYKGTEPAVGQDIYLTCSRWSLSLYSEPYSIERGFVNIMEVGGEYLVFIENQVDGLGEKIPVYQVYVENAFTPIFSYQEHENNICETGGESTYVKYNQVCENEFFATTQKGMAALVASLCLNLCHLNSDTSDTVSAAAGASGGSVAGLRMTMTLFPILLLVIGVIFFHKKYKLTDERLKEIQEASI